jgi:hypothetical protein
MGFLGVVTAILGLALWQDRLHVLTALCFVMAVIFCVLHRP